MLLFVRPPKAVDNDCQEGVGPGKHRERRIVLCPMVQPDKHLVLHFCLCDGVINPMVGVATDTLEFLGWQSILIAHGTDFQQEVDFDTVVNIVSVVIIVF